MKNKLKDSIIRIDELKKKKSDLISERRLKA